MRCRHCHKEIHYLRNAERWIHTRTFSVWCDESATIRAEPK